MDMSTCHLWQCRINRVQNYSFFLIFKYNYTLFLYNVPIFLVFPALYELQYTSVPSLFNRICYPTVFSYGYVIR